MADTDSVFEFLHMQIVEYIHEVHGKENENDATYKLEEMGYTIGQRLAERFTKETARFKDDLDVMKYICKEFWTALYKKQIDNLRTNHQGVFVLQDNRFRLLTQISDTEEFIKPAAKYLSLPCGLIRGALANLGIPSIVGAEITMPMCENIVIPLTNNNTCQPQPQYDPRVVSESPAPSNEVIDPGNENETCSQPVLQFTQPHDESNVSELISNVTASDSHNISSTSARVFYDDTTHLRPQYHRPSRLGDVTVELEEVDIGTALGGSGLISLAQSANAEEIGRWGEECVYMLLKHIEKDHQVVWVNEIAESGLPYDIRIKGKDVEIFIEIKSTSASEKHVLEISSQEIKCAFEKREDYHLYRVYNAGNQRDCRVARLRNLASNLDTKAVSLFIFI
ncbi:Hypothetical predicted protein [Paramuricea clavata]|uniref:Uncharacterized protein n=1 Tax=Paramuricea clavata TaxID=317549 RepID=A0A6S7G073_PARCT|nr:Hypothetical predicted protein [Paramuricea clavata]